MTLLSEGRRGARLYRAAAAGRSRALAYLPGTAFVLDAMLITAACLLAVLGRRSIDIFGGGSDVGHTLELVGPLLVAGWLATVATLGGYKQRVFGAGVQEYKDVLNASLITASGLGVICYLAKFQLSRGFFVLAFLIGIPLLLLGRLLLRRAIHQARRQGALLQRVLITGLPGNADAIAAVLQRDRWLGYQVIGVLTPARFLEEETPAGLPVLGNVDDAAGLVDQVGADVVFCAGGGHESPAHLRQLAWALERHHVQLIVAPSVTDVSSERVTIRPVAGLPLIHLEPPQWQYAARWAKRTFDLLGALALIICFAPILAFIALRVKVNDGGPILFRQVRVGRDGVEFECLKFRTMVTNAEALLAELHAQEGHDSGLFKMKDDPRVTRPGRWLRRYSLDELPQLFNVLRGDMSLVGPRPPLPSEAVRYDEGIARRLRVRPGMTGLWQVSGRSDLTWDEAVRLDLYYVDNWSMVQDVAILFRTFSAVFSSRGAY